MCWENLTTELHPLIIIINNLHAQDWINFLQENNQCKWLYKYHKCSKFKAVNTGDLTALSKLCNSTDITLWLRGI